jgi:tellurite resistance protein TehA-like permease
MHEPAQSVSSPPPEEAAIAPAGPADRPPRFRWRILPVIACGLFGLSGLLSGIVQGVLLIQIAMNPNRFMERFEQAVVGSVFLATAGAAWLAAGVMIWRGRWRWAAGLVTLGAGFTWAAGRFS